MSKRATRNPKDQLPPNPDEAAIPTDHPDDVRTYPTGSKIVGSTLELPTSGISDGTKAQAAFDAAVAKVEGAPFESHGVNLGAEGAKNFGLAAATAEDREKGEQIVNSGSLSKPQDETIAPRKTIDIDQFLGGLSDEQKAEFYRRFSPTAPAPFVDTGPAGLVGVADIKPIAEFTADQTAKIRRMELRDKIEAEVVRHEKAFDDLVSGACQTDSPLTQDAIRQLRLTALGFADDPTKPLYELEGAYDKLVEVRFDYPNTNVDAGGGT